MTAAKSMSPDGRAFLKAREVFVAHPYWDLQHWSIGWGHQCTKADPLVWDASGCPTGSITEEQGDDMLTRDLRVYEGCVNSHVCVDLTQAQFDALVDFAYNEGCGALIGSTLLRLLNAGDYAGAAAHLPEWDKDLRGGMLVVDPGLLERRKLEVAMFLGADAPPDSAA